MVKYLLPFLLLICNSCIEFRRSDATMSEVDGVYPFLTDKNLMELNQSVPISTDSVASFLKLIGVSSPVLRIDTSLVKYVHYVIPTVLVYRNKQTLSRNICNAHFPGLIEDCKQWDRRDKNWNDEPTLEKSKLEQSLIGYNHVAKANEIEIFYFYDIFFDNLVRNQMAPLYKKSLNTGGITVHLVNINNHPGMNLSADQFKQLRLKHNPISKSTNN